MTISHTGINVASANLKAVLAWYDAALAPLTYKKVMSFADGMANGYAEEATPQAADWWVSAAPEGKTPVASHHAFDVKDRATVDAFYKAALAAGGKDNGGPGVRADYGPNYYAAFVFDPAGNNIEVVCMAPAS